MIFSDQIFLIFIIVLIPIYWLSPQKLRNPILLVFSYYFYGYWNWKFTVLLAITTFIDFFVGLKIHKANETGNLHFKKRLLILSILANLGILAFFKYYNFFIVSVIEALNFVHLNPSIPILNIILPVGISFYTFQSMSYTLDIYRNKLKPTTNFINFALYVSLFTQLVAGPIERAITLLPQIESKRKKVNWGNIKKGLVLVFIGYIKKVVISDNIGPLVDYTFLNYAILNSIELVSGLIFFSMQIYFDFSGYTDIARGISRFFGFELMMNFNQPYLSRNITEFWERWHISLSTWLRDYLYIPLGGNRNGEFRTYINLMLTMLLGGLWHGASWNFVLWGGLHGIYLVVNKAIKTPRYKDNIRFNGLKSIFSNLFNCTLTYFLVLITWLPFRTKNISETIDYVKGIFFWKGSIDFNSINLIILIFIVLLLVDVPAYIYKEHEFLLRFPRWLLFSIFIFGIVGIVLTMYFRIGGARPFIYFQF